MPSEPGQTGELMDRAASGDDAAFGQLALEMQDALFRFALAHGLGGADAAEAIQETFLRAYRALGRWRRGGDARAWLYGIAMNVVREFHRRRRREAPGLDVELLLGAPADGGDDPFGAGELAALAAAVAGLPRRQREAVSCRYLRQMSVRETAAAMGCAEGTVKAAVFAGLGNLRRAMRQAQR